MKQVLILSGKGGTGKTTIASAFIRLAQAKAFADCDIDAPNLHLSLTQQSQPIEKDFYGLDKAFIKPDHCAGCGLCVQYCRFEAIQIINDHYQVNEIACEGCGLCFEICPTKTIEMRPQKIGNLSLFKSQHVFSTAQLKMGSGNSGLLVSEVKKQLKRNLLPETDLAIIDGSPGIGCPVIASVSGVDFVLIVTEPSISGLSDLERIIKTTQILQVETLVCINKADTNIQISQKIKAYCDTHHLPFLGEIAYDPTVLKALNQNKNILEYSCKASEDIHLLYQQLIKYINNQTN